MYRPENWENPYSMTKREERLHLYDTEPRNAYEAGADAMLAYLKSQEHEDWLATEEGQASKGQWYYIPDEQE